MDTKVIVAIAVLVAVQLTLQVSALVQLVRTPTERITLGGRKWLWVLIIALGEIIGPIVWFAAGRTADTTADTGAVADAQRRDSVVDELYGPKA